MDKGKIFLMRPNVLRLVDAGVSDANDASHSGV